MKTLIISDLHPGQTGSNSSLRELSPEELKRIQGGRAVSVTVDGSSTGKVDDFDINTAIFEGRIQGPFLL